MKIDCISDLHGSFPELEEGNGKDEKGKNMSEESRIKLEDCVFSLRTSRMLNLLKIEYLDELKNISAKELLGFRNIGKKSVDEIRNFLARYGNGMILKDDVVLSYQEQKNFVLEIKATFVNICNKIKEIQNELIFLEIKIDNIS